MIVVVTGPPGAGKTYYTVRTIAKAVLGGKFVATNVLLADDWAERIANTTVLRFMPGRRRRKCEAWRRRLIYVESLDDLARVRLDTAGHEKALEGRGIAVFDEAGEALDSRDWNVDKERRKAQNRFARQHRKLGWDVYFVAQEAEQLDTRVRGMAEYEVQLRNLRRFKMCGLSLFPFNFFMAIWRWHAGKSRERARLETFLLNRKIAGLYNTFQLVQTVSCEALTLPAPVLPTGAMLTPDDLARAADAALDLLPESREDDAGATLELAPANESDVAAPAAREAA